MTRILVVDDDRGIRGFLVEALVDEGYEARGAVDGVAALATAEEWRPDLILLDLMMPRMTGQEFRAEQLRRPALADVPVVVLSAVADRLGEEHRPGIAAIIGKPVDLSLLLAVVERYAGGASSSASPPSGR